MKTFRPAILIAAIAAASYGFSEDTGELFFKSKIGSFKAIQRSKDPMKGVMTLTFKGTLLISKPTPGTKVTVTGNLKLEKEVKKYNKQVYYGDGTVTIDGSWNAIQVFGKNLDGHFKGNGFFRLYGEFDSKLDTGEFWVPGGEHTPWGTGGYPVVVPPEGAAAAPEVKVNPTKKGKG